MATDGGDAGRAAREPNVLVVEDDPLVRGSLCSLLRSAGFVVDAYASASELLLKPLPDEVSCLVVDVRLPRASGFDLQAELKARGEEIPIVFMTGHGDVPMTVRAMKAGAVDFLSKPFRDQDMLDAVTLALDRSRAQRDARTAERVLRDRYASLTKREREVHHLVADGLLNKQIAQVLGITEITVKLHRGNLMRKMEAPSLVQLIRMAETLERLEPVPPRSGPTRP